MTTDDAVAQLRSDPRLTSLIRDAYFDADVQAAADRFASSAEFAEILRILGGVRGSVIADVGAGGGIASYAFAKHAASRVYAVEPDPSLELGQGAIRKITGNLPIEIVTAYGEALPFADGMLDVVFVRQVLHHTRDLPQVMREFLRVLRPGGILLACREHVVDDADQLSVFLANHPVHQLTGTENAFPVRTYLSAIEQAGFRSIVTLGNWDSIINAFPAVRSEEERKNAAIARLRDRFGALGAWLAKIPGVEAMAWQRLKRPLPGRLYSFVAHKP